jgi:hypothetical protein
LEFYTHLRCPHRRKTEGERPQKKDKQVLCIGDGGVRAARARGTHRKERKREGDMASGKMTRAAAPMCHVQTWQKTTLSIEKSEESKSKKKTRRKHTANIAL